MKTITLVVLVTVVVSASVGTATAQRTGRAAAEATPAEHKQMMSDAGDTQEDLRISIAEKDTKAAIAAAAKLEAFMNENQIYWAAKGFQDVTAAADLALAQSKEVATAVSAGKLEDGRSALEKLSVTCNSCHELHAEHR